LRGEAFADRRDLVEILDDDRGIDDDLAVMDEGVHHPIRVEREIFGCELVAGEEIELSLLEGEPFGVENEPDPLAAGRLRRIVERERHPRRAGYSAAARCAPP
jgi:hypothetical protein